jgi:PII-like signaling protein
MRYRHLTNTKIEVIENDLKILRMIVQRQEPITKYLEQIQKTEENLAEVKNLIAIEPFTDSEVAD